MFYLGTITGSSGACYNRQTGVSGLGTFEIPKTTKALWFVPSMSGMGVLISQATGITNFCNAANFVQLDYPGVQGPYRVTADHLNGNVQVAIYSPAPGSAALFTSVRVFSGPTS